MTNIEVFKPTVETIILIFGLLSVLAALERIPELNIKSSLYKLLFVVGIVTQLSAHCFQYIYAVANRTEAAKRIEAETAIALLAFASDREELLKATSTDPYLVGYWLWSKKRKDDAIRYFIQAIANGKFIASSNYLLAVYYSHADDLRFNEDLAKAHKYLKAAMANNPDYAPAYYLEALLYMNERRQADALEDLEKAVLSHQFGRLPCEDLNTPVSADRIDPWAQMRDKPQYGDKLKELQTSCALQHALKPGSK